jgi:hypothetical protein
MQINNKDEKNEEGDVKEECQIRKGILIPI